MNINLKQVHIRNAAPEDVRGINQVLYQARLATYPNTEIGLTKEDIEYSYADTFTEETIKKN